MAYLVSIFDGDKCVVRAASFGTARQRGAYIMRWTYGGRKRGREYRFEKWEGEGEPHARAPCPRCRPVDPGSGRRRTHRGPDPWGDAMTSVTVMLGCIAFWTLVTVAVIL